MSHVKILIGHLILAKRESRLIISLSVYRHFFVSRSDRSGTMADGSLQNTVRVVCLGLVASGFHGCAFFEALRGLCDADRTVYAVTKTEDTRHGVCLAEDCSLHEAISHASACPAAGPVTVQLQSARVYEVRNRGRPVIFPDIAKNIILEGQGSTIRRTGPADRLFAGRFFYVAPRGNLTVRDLRLEQGYTSGRLDEDRDGGAILNDGGTLTVERSIFFKNEASGSGGAISNRGTLIVSESTFEENESPSIGGAIDNSGAMQVERSTFVGNRGDVGGAVAHITELPTGFDPADPLRSNFSEIRSSTFLFNQGYPVGGGVAHQGGLLKILDSTFAFNTGRAGAAVGMLGVAVGATAVPARPDRDGILAIGNTIMAYGRARDGTRQPNCGVSIIGGDGLGPTVGTFRDLSEGLIRLSDNISTDRSCGFVHDDRNPRFAAYGWNGGPTKSFIIARDAAGAYNRGTDCLSVDQRGGPRPFERCDIGSVELTGLLRLPDPEWPPRFD